MYTWAKKFCPQRSLPLILPNESVFHSPMFCLLSAWRMLCTTAQVWFFYSFIVRRYCFTLREGCRSFNTVHTAACSERGLCRHSKQIDRNEDKRSFLAPWFGQHPCLYYLQRENVAFYFACRHFCHWDKGEETFTSKGFQNWKKADNGDKGIIGYEKVRLYGAAMTVWCKCNKLKLGGQGSVAQMHSLGYSKQVGLSENRYLRDLQ